MSKDKDKEIENNKPLKESSDYVQDVTFIDKSYDNVMKEKEKEKEEFELNIDYVEGLYKTIFINRMIEERNRIISEKIKEERENLKNEGLSYFERKKKEKTFEKDLYESYYSIEKDLIEQRKKAIERYEELEKENKKTSKLNESVIQEKKQLETEYLLGDTLEDYIQTVYMSNKIQDKLKNKFNDITEKLDSDVMAISNQKKYENKNLRRADGITRQFSKEFPEVKKEVNGFMSKLKIFSEKNQKAIKTAGYILTGVGLVTNLPATAAVLGFNAIMKTKSMEKIKKNISNDISNGLNKMGIDKESKLRKGLKRVAVVAGLGAGIAVGLAAGNVDISEITKLGGETLTGLSEGIGELQNIENLANNTSIDNNLANNTSIDNNLANNASIDNNLENTNSIDNNLENTNTTEEIVNQEVVNQEEAIQLEEMQKATTEFLNSNLENIKDSLFEQELNDKKWSLMASEMSIDKDELEQIVKGNLYAQIEQGEFPTTIEMELQSYDGVITHEVNFSADEMKDIVNMLAQEQGANISLDSLSEKLPEVTQGVNVEGNLTSFEVKSGDTLTGMLEKVDGVEFDLIGEDLTAVAQLIAEQNNIPDPDKIFPGQMINMPSDPESLQQFVENNQDRLQEILNENSTQTIDSVVEPAVEPTSNTFEADFIKSNSENITNSLFEQEMSNRDWSKLESRLGVEKEEIQNLVQQNLEKQVEEGKFPTAIQLELNSYDGKEKEIIDFSANKIEQTASFIAQESGIKNENNVVFNYDDNKIESTQQVEKQEGLKQKKGMKLS